jgi:hypothetical protein
MQKLKSGEKGSNIRAMERNGELKNREVRAGGNNGTDFHVEKLTARQMFKFGDIVPGYYLVVRNEKGFVISIGGLSLTKGEADKLRSDRSQELVNEAKSLFNIS